MKDSDIERQIREHYRTEVDRVRAGMRRNPATLSAGQAAPTDAQAAPRVVPPAGPRTGRAEILRRAVGYIAAAAAIAMVPMLMFLGRASHEPLALAIQVQWDQAGRGAMIQALREAGRVLDTQGRALEEEK